MSKGDLACNKGGSGARLPDARAVRRASRPPPAGLDVQLCLVQSFLFPLKNLVLRLCAALYWWGHMANLLAP